MAAAIKDELHINGVINPYLANAATRIIGNPEFQRVKDRLEDDLSLIHTDAADDLLCVDLGCRRIIKKKILHL